jgi:hypothetical protein
MELKSFIPIIAAIVGGLLTVVGGFFSQYFLQKRQRQSQKYSRTVDKLEEIGRIANKILKSGMRLRNAPLHLVMNMAQKVEKDINDQFKLSESQNDEFILLTELYVPELLGLAKEMVNAETAIGKYMVDNLVNLIRTKGKEQFRDLITQMNKQAFKLGDELSIKHELFMNTLSETFSKYRYKSDS